VAGRPLRPATDHRLGKPLPHQLANRPQAPPRAGLLPFFSTPLESRTYAELPAVSHGYPPPQGRLPTCYAPVRRAAPPKGSALDLHALGTPPALILSQDQTLHQWLSRLSRSLRRAGPRRDPGPPKGSSVACDGHAALSGLLAVCEPIRSTGPPVSRRPSPPAARSVFGTRRATSRKACSLPLHPPRYQLVNVQSRPL
jgi:hypothetical protein